MSSRLSPEVSEAQVITSVTWESSESLGLCHFSSQTRALLRDSHKSSCGGFCDVRDRTDLERGVPKAPQTSGPALHAAARARGCVKDQKRDFWVCWDFGA